MLRPLATASTIMPRVRRLLRIRGFPPNTSGFIVMRCNSMIVVILLWGRETGKGLHDLAHETDAVAVLAQDGVGGQQSQVFVLCLSDEHAVEGVPMMPRQERYLARLRRRERQILERLRSEFGVEIRRDAEFAEAHLEPDLPVADGTDEDSVAWIADESARLAGEGGMIGAPPQNQVGIE